MEEYDIEMKHLVITLDDKQLNRLSKALENASKEMEASKNAIDKLVGFKKPKWYQFWKTHKNN